jgi:formyl-CoA transferase
MTGVLSGVRVVELGQVLAGPFAGAIFADLGADVIKVEKPDGGDDARRMGPDFRHGDALNFHEFNRGKKSITLDLKSPEGVEALHGLLTQADIMLHNLRPGAAEALGIGAQAVTARHPHLIYCEMSAFGHVGPEKLRPGYEPLLQAFGGLSSITGEPDGPPVRMGASVVDQGTGLWTVLGALAMLEQRHRTGQGGVVNTSLFETALLWAGQKISAYVNMGKLPERHASGHPNLTPYEAFDAADGPVLICCGNDRLFAKFAAELGHARIGVPCAPVNSIPEVLAEPQTRALGMVQPVPNEDFSLVAMPLSFNGERPRMAGPAPRLGAHNAEILKG